MPVKECLWHKCKSSFEREVPQQKFCSAKCQKDRAKWKRVRGPALVDLLINGEGEKLIVLRKKLMKEIDDG